MSKQNCHVSKIWKYFGWRKLGRETDGSRIVEIIKKYGKEIKIEKEG